ncbi:MAG: 6-phosphogluconolactonase [Hyphomicrobiales bacterium]
MKIVEVADYAEMSRRVAAIVVSQLRDKPDALLIFPTGETPRGLFRELSSLRKHGALDCGRMRVATLDEYAGLARDDRRRLTLWLERELLNPLEIGDDRVIAFDPAASDAEAECARVEREIADGIDLAIVGLGPNGHVGFNEPGSPFDSRARLVALAPESIRSNAAYWGSEAQVPPTALTLGLGTISQSRRLVLMASGRHKADVLAQVISGPIGPELPGTMLRLHSDATIVADREALSEPPT